jgi:hypothetical protein
MVVVLVVTGWAVLVSQEVLVVVDLLLQLVTQVVQEVQVFQDKDTQEPLVDLAVILQTTVSVAVAVVLVVQQSQVDLTVQRKVVQDLLLQLAEHQQHMQAVAVV